MTTERREDTSKNWVYVRLTNAGEKRITELRDAGIEASARWAELTFDEAGLPPHEP
jgi:hypothetical protein